MTTVISHLPYLFPPSPWNYYWSSQQVVLPFRIGLGQNLEVILDPLVLSCLWSDYYCCITNYLKTQWHKLKKYGYGRDIVVPIFGKCYQPLFTFCPQLFTSFPHAKKHQIPPSKFPKSHLIAWSLWCCHPDKTQVPRSIYGYGPSSMFLLNLWRAMGQRFQLSFSLSPVWSTCSGGSSIGWLLQAFPF